MADSDDFIGRVSSDADCSADSIQLTQQGSDSSDRGTHYFDLEPLSEGTWSTTSLKKYHRNSSDTIATLEHLTIVNLIDEGIGNECAWCKVEVVDKERSLSSSGVIGYVKRSQLTRLQTGEYNWNGATTLPSPKITCTGETKNLKALVPNWIRLSACEPFLNKKTLKYCTTVTTGHKNLDEREMLVDQATKVGIKQLLVYYDKCPPGYDVRTLDDAVSYLQKSIYQFATVEQVHVSSRPNERVKALVCVNMSFLTALPAMVRTFTTTTQIHTGHRTAIYQSNTIQKKFKLMADTMDRLQPYIELFPGTIKGPGKFSASKQGDRLRNFVPVLKKLMRANGYQLRKDHEDLIEIGTDAEFNPTHVIVYIDGVGKPQTVGFNAYASQPPCTSQRVMHYVLQGNNMYSESRTPEMQGLSPPWLKYITKYTYPPLEIRPTPPSGLSLGSIAAPPNLAGLKSIQSQFNKLPLKGPAELSLERVQLSDPKFLTSMADARINVALPAGDNIVANLPVVLDKINSLDDVFGELLQKISIPKLIEQAMAKLMAELGLDNIYAALLASVLEQFSAEMLLEQFMFQLPDDLLGDLIDQLLEMIDINCDDIIQILVKSGLQTDALQSIVDQIGDTMEGLQDSIDAAMGAIPAPCGSDLDAGIDETLTDELDEQLSSIEDVLANLECDDLKGILKNVVTMGMPKVEIQKPTIDLSCFVIDIELLIAKIMMPLIPLLADGATLDIHRLGEIDWSGLSPEMGEMDLKIAAPDGTFKRFGDDTRDGFDSPDGLSDLGIGLGMPKSGFDIGALGGRLDRPDLLFPDSSSGLTLPAFPNINLQSAFSDISIDSFPQFVSEISGMATGKVAGLELTPNTDPTLEDLSFTDLLNGWKAVMLESFAGLMLNNFVFAAGGGGKAFVKLHEMIVKNSASGTTTDAGESSTSVPNFPEWDATGAACDGSAGIGIQSLIEMPTTWQTEIESTIPTLSDVEALKEDISEDAVELLNAIDALTTIVADGFTGLIEGDPCALMDKLAAFDFSGVEFDGAGYDADYGISVHNLMLPSFVIKPQVTPSLGCGPYKIMGLPNFGLNNISLPLPITGEEGTETFDILDMDMLLGKLPDLPNFPELVGADIELSCEVPELFTALLSVMMGQIPTPEIALGRLETELGRIPDLEAVSAGEIPAVSAKKLGVIAFNIAIDRLGLGTFAGHMADILKGKLSAGELDINILLEIPIIKEKFDLLIAGMPSMPTMQLPSLPGVDLEVPSLNLPGGGAIGSGFKIPTITLPDNIPTGDLMGGLFSGMQDSVKGAIESALVEMGKEVLRSLIQGAADNLGDASFGDANIADLLADSLGSFDAALAVLEGAFANAGVNSDGTLVSTTTVTVEMGCGDEIDPSDPDNEMCTPYDFVTAVSQRMTSGEVVELLEGRVSPNMCATIQEVVIDGCPVYAAIFDDCGKIQETFEAIGEYIQPDILDKKRFPVSPAVQDLQRLCCDAEVDVSKYAQLLRNKGLEDDQIDGQLEEVTQRKQDALEDLAKLLTGLQNDDLLDGLIPPIYPEEDCGECSQDSEAGQGSLMPPDSEIPTLDFMNNMVVDMMYEPTRLMFKMETDALPQLLESGSVSEEVIPVWDKDYDCVSHYAEMLYNQGAALCNHLGDLDAVSKAEWQYMRSKQGDGEDGALDESNVGDLFVKKQNNSGSVAPLLRSSLLEYNYIDNTWDSETGTYIWSLRYSGDAEHYSGTWPAVTWTLQPPTAEQLGSYAAASETVIPSSDTTAIGEIMGVSCGEPTVIENESEPESTVGRTGEEIVPRMSSAWVTGEPQGYQVFKQFIKNKMIDLPAFEGYNVEEDANYVSYITDAPFETMYANIMNQIFQSAGVQTAFTKLFEMRDLQLVELEPALDAPSNACGDKPLSLLDIENTAKNTTKDSLAKACMSPVLEQATGKNATKQAGLDGCVMITIRAYVIDVALRSIFPLSEFELIDFKDGFYSSVVNAITTDMEAMDPSYYTDFMDTMPQVLSKLCKAAKCEGEPWIDPDTGEEMDCDSFGGTEGLKFLVKRQMQEIAPILKEKFGTNPPSLSMRLMKDWLINTPIAEQQWDRHFSVHDCGTGPVTSQQQLYNSVYGQLSEESSTAQDGTYVWGITDSGQYLAQYVTPTAAEAEAIGIAARTEPVYSGYPENIPAPRFWTYSTNNLVDSDAADFYQEFYDAEGIFVTSTGGETTSGFIEDATSGASRRGVLPIGERDTTANPEKPEEALDGNPHNSLYFNLTNGGSAGTTNWLPPSLDKDIQASSISGELGQGLFIETFIKVGDEYWNPNNLEDFINWVYESISQESDIALQEKAVLTMQAYEGKKVKYGSRLAYVDSSTYTGMHNIRKLCINALGTQDFPGTGTGIFPNMAPLGGAYYNAEGEIFEKETITTEMSGEEGDLFVPDGTGTGFDAATKTYTSTVEIEQDYKDHIIHPLVEVTTNIAESLFSAKNTDGDITFEDLIDIESPAGSTSFNDNYKFTTPFSSASGDEATIEVAEGTIADALLDAAEDLRNEMLADADFKILFDYCFPTSLVTEMIWYYCAMMTAESVDGIRQAFSATKDELRKLFIILYNDIGTGGDGFSYQAETEVDTVDSATDMAGTDSGGNIALKMAAMTIPLLIKGLAETFDPNIRLAKLITMGVEAGGGSIAKFPATLAALPFNIIPPPPFGPGIGPPITPLGIAYLALGALTPVEKQTMRLNDANGGVPAPPDPNSSDAEECNPNVNEEADT